MKLFGARVVGKQAGEILAREPEHLLGRLGHRVGGTQRRGLGVGDEAPDHLIDHVGFAERRRRPELDDQIGFIVLVFGQSVQGVADGICIRRGIVGINRRPGREFPKHTLLP